MRKNATPARVEPPGPAPIPFFDLGLHHRPLRAELLRAIAEVADSNRFINGPAVARFEQAFAERLGARHAVGASSGTDALLMALMAQGIGPGDEVVTTPFTFMATAEVVLRVGAKLVLADIDPATLLLSPEAVGARLSPKTKAIIPVHLYGLLCNMEALARISGGGGPALLEDCAQSMGAKRGGVSAGCFGTYGAFSFFPTKNLGAWGDGGMLVTPDAAIAERLRWIRDHGAKARDRYEVIGGNFRLDTVQAAVLEIKLRHLSEFLERRRQAARQYQELFGKTGLAAPAGRDPDLSQPVVLPPIAAGEEHAFNLFVIRALDRDTLKEALEKRGIGAMVYYPTPVHLQPCFASLGHGPGDFPVAERAALTVLALPFFPEIREEQQALVVEAVVDFYRGRR